MELLKATYAWEEWPRDFESLCAVLLHQQCWCWGQDIRCSNRNLLLEYGFERIRPPANIRGSSRYQMRLSLRSTITLWGFGIYYSRCGRGGIYLNRYDCVPRYCPHVGFLEGVWTPEALPLTPLASCLRTHDRDTGYLVAKTMDWMGSYERWVVETYGKPYRRQTLRDWHEPSILPERMPEEWTMLGGIVRLRSAMRDPHAA